MFILFYILSSGNLNSENRIRKIKILQLFTKLLLKIGNYSTTAVESTPIDFKHRSKVCKSPGLCFEKCETF